MELPDYVYNPAAPSIYAICQIITKNFLFVNIFLEYFEKLSKSNLGEPPAGGRGNAPLELAGWWQPASSSNPRGSAQSTFALTPQRGGGVKVLLFTFSLRK